MIREQQCLCKNENAAPLDERSYVGDVLGPIFPLQEVTSNPHNVMAVILTRLVRAIFHSFAFVAWS